MVKIERLIELLLSDLQMRQAELETQLRVFDDLQQEISQLQDQAAHDPSAAAKLQGLSEQLKDNKNSEVQEVFEQKLLQLDGGLAALEQQFRELVSTLTPTTASKESRHGEQLRHISDLI